MGGASLSAGVGTGRARPIWDAGVTALFALTRLGREGRSAALPMGLCFPCPGESTPPSPDPVSKAAFPRLRVRRPAPRAPVPGREASSRGHLSGSLEAVARAWEPAAGSLVVKTCGRAPKDVGILLAGPGPPPPGLPTLVTQNCPKAAPGSFSLALTWAKFKVRRTQACADGAV